MYFENLTKKQCDGIETIAWGMEHFGGVLTNRHFTKKTAKQLVNLGIAKSLGLVCQCDGDGFILHERVRREGFALTESGVSLHGRLKDHYKQLRNASGR